jgi:hypothetical protein
MGSLEARVGDKAVQPILPLKYTTCREKRKEKSMLMLFTVLHNAL